MIIRDILNLLKVEPKAGANLLVIDPTTGEVGFVAGSPLTTSLPEGQIFVGNGLNNASAVAVTGDISITAEGLVTIEDEVIENINIAEDAAIDFTKMEALDPNTVAVFDGDGFLMSSTTPTAKLVFINNVTSDVQTQLNAKQATITGGASTIATTNLTADFVLVSNSSGKVVVSSTAALKLSFLDNVTSDIQEQLDSKLSVVLASVAEGDIIWFDGTNFVNLAVGGAGTTLQSNGTVPSWGPGTANGIPSGGTVGQFLKKVSSLDFEADWFDLVLGDLTDVVATVDEVNALVGITVNADDLNTLTSIGGNVQGQINGKLARLLPQNSLFVGLPGNIPGFLSPGDNGAVLTMVSGSPVWSPFSSFGTFISLSDVPHDYTDFGGYYIRVNASEDGLEFVAGGSGGGSVNDANNGLDLDGDVAQLGGLLLQDTTIDGDGGTFDLTVTGVDDLSLDGIHVMIMSDNEIDLVADEILINGSAGTDGQLVRSTGSGSAMIWQTVDLGYILAQGNDAAASAITNLLDAVDPQDATTLSQVETLIEDATYENVVDLGDISGSISIDLSTGRHFKCRATGNISSLSYSNEKVGAEYSLSVLTETSNKTVAFASSKWRWPNGSAAIPQLTQCTANGSSPASAVDIFIFKCTISGRLDVMYAPNLIEN